MLLNRELPLYTRKGNRIPNEMREERPPQSMKDAIKFSTKICPDATPRSASAVYNCMGLIFASRRTCIEPEHLFNILNDDDYHKLNNLNDIEIGDIVVYRDTKDNQLTHVDVVVNKNPNIKKAEWKITVLSQWGADGEYIHPMECVPEIYFGKPMEYWTDRRQIS